MKNYLKHGFNAVAGVAGATVSAGAALSIISDAMSSAPELGAPDVTTLGLFMVGGLALFTGAYNRWTRDPKTNDGTDAKGMGRRAFHGAAAYVGGAMAGLANPEAALAGLLLFAVGYGRVFSDKPASTKKPEIPVSQNPNGPA